LVVEAVVARGMHRPRLVPLRVEQRIDHSVTIAVHDRVEVTGSHRFEPGPSRQDAQGDVKSDPVPLIDHPSRVIFYG
jgi:hypothetical protein